MNSADVLISAESAVDCRPGIIAAKRGAGFGGRGPDHLPVPVLDSNGVNFIPTGDDGRIEIDFDVTGFEVG